MRIKTEAIDPLIEAAYKSKASLETPNAKLAASKEEYSYLFDFILNLLQDLKECRALINSKPMSEIKSNASQA